jgi:hypothetical protein
MARRRLSTAAPALGLHARAEAVRLHAVAAIGLKCALGHENALLFPVQNLRLDGKIQVYRRLGQESSGAKLCRDVNRAEPASKASFLEAHPVLQKCSTDAGFPLNRCRAISLFGVTLVTLRGEFHHNGATHPDGKKLCERGLQ